VKSGTEAEHSHTYQFYMKHCLQVNNYIQGNSAKL